MIAPAAMLASGRTFPLLAPAPADVDLDTIAEGLGKQPRFAGQTPGLFYSVAQHSLLVESLLPDTHDGFLKAYGMLHDAHEFVLGDRAAPLKQALAIESPAAAEAWARIVDRIDAAIAEACGLPWPLHPDDAALVDVADLSALATEARDLMPAGTIDRALLPAPAPRRVVPVAWDRAAAAWLDRFRELAVTYGWRGPAVTRALQDT